MHEARAAAEGTEVDHLSRALVHLRQAQRVLARDHAAAFSEGDWNLAVRRAEEGIVYAARGVLLAHSAPLGASRPVPIAKALDRKDPDWAARVGADPLLGPCAVLLWSEASPWRFAALRKGRPGLLVQADGVWPGFLGQPFGTDAVDATIRDLLSGQAGSDGPAGVRVLPVSVTPSEWARVEQAGERLETERHPALRFEEILGRGDAEGMGERAWGMLRLALSAVGRCGLGAARV